MAQSGYTPLSLYYSATATNTPLATNLVAGELALNTADGKLFYKDSSGVVQVIASKAGNVNVSSFSGGTTGLTPNTATTGAVTLAGTLAVANGGTGVTTSTGSGSNVLSTSPTLVTPVLGTPTSVTLTNATGLPLSTGVTGTLAVTNGGTGQTTASAAFNALSPITSTGDLIIGNGSNSATRLAIGTSGYVLTSNGTTATWVAAGGGGGGVSWQTVKTANFNATTGNAYPINTTSGAITVTLPASPSAGNYVTLTDYAGTFATNALTINANGGKIDGAATNGTVSTNRSTTSLVWIDSTQGWITFSNVTPLQLSTASYLIVAGGGGGGYTNGGGGGAGGILTGSLTLTPGTTYSFTVGAGGTGSSSSGSNGSNGSNSTGFSQTAIGGGGGGSSSSGTASSGGSGGGGGNANAAGGAGTGGQGYAGGHGSNNQGSCGGGGGAGAIGVDAPGSNGGNGGDGISSSITGTATYYGGGGGGSCDPSYTPGTGGQGGGGNGEKRNASNGSAGTANTGGGGGGGGDVPGYNGGSGVVIISIPTASYSGVTSGSPTVTTSGSNTIMKFTSSGSYTA